MKMKSILAALAVSLIIPTSAFASSGWDYVGTSTFVKSSVVMYSTGGDFKACQVGGTSQYVNLWENDPDNPDDPIDGFMTGTYLPANGCATWDVRHAVDGSNKKAELYLLKASDGKSMTVKFYD